MNDFQPPTSQWRLCRNVIAKAATLADAIVNAFAIYFLAFSVAHWWQIVTAEWVAVVAVAFYVSAMWLNADDLREATFSGEDH